VTATAQDPNDFNDVDFPLDYLNSTARDLCHLDWSVDRDHSAFCLMGLKSNGLQFLCVIFDHNGNLSDILCKDDDVITEGECT
jgi:hypothetical protein